MANMISALLASRKAWVLLLCVAGAMVLNAKGQIDGPQALDFIKWVVGAWLAAVAAEDAAKKMAPGTASTGDAPQGPQNGA